MNDNNYPDYLKNLIIDPPHRHHGLLLDHLWRKEYYSIIPNDQNRAKDGTLLRDIEDGPDYTYYYGPCSVLEMLIALSKRMEYEISGTGYNVTYRDLFWEMIDNLDLSRFNDVNVINDSETNEIDYILTNWIERRYSSDGSGGIFPIKKWRRGVDSHQNKIEIWYQMMNYLSKNYPFD